MREREIEACEREVLIAERVCVGVREREIEECVREVLIAERERV